MFVVLFLLFALNCAGDVSECQCGYGGLCLSRWPGTGHQNCGLWVCEEISGGFYTGCTSIKNHCESSPCQNLGLCFQTFGSYYCKCEKGYCGHHCQYPCQPEFKIIAEAGVSTHASIYYQIQPRPDGTNRFHVIFDPGDQAWLLKRDIEIRINVSLSDGRSFFPTKNHFQLDLIKSRCVQETSVNPSLYDKRVCDLLPAGEKWVFPVDVTYYEGYRNLNQSAIINGINGEEIGITGKVHLAIELRNLKNSNRYNLFEWTYKIFGYTSYREPHNCKAGVLFSGCSNDKEYPRLISRGHFMKIWSVFREKSCRGTHFLGVDWFFQRNVERDENFVHDAVPQLIAHLDQPYAEIPRRTFYPGLHMFLFTEKLRGNPPHYGGPTPFAIFGRCWMRVIVGEPMLQVKWGSERFARCDRDLVFELRFFNPAYSSTEFTFTMRCNNSNDPDCNQRPIEATHVQKYRACDESYNFTFSAFGRKGFPDASTNVLIHFRRRDLELHLNCIYNCFPVDPSNRVLLRASLHPYSENPVSWVFTVGSSVYTQGDGHFSLFIKSTASRLFRANGPRFIESGVTSSDITFKVIYPSKVDVLTAENSFSVNIEFQARSFELLNVEHGTFRFVDPKRVDIRTAPVRYRIYSIFNMTKLFYVAVDVTQKELLTFQSVGDLASVCMLDAFFTEACSDPVALNKDGTPPTPQVNLGDLEDIMASGDSYRFLKDVLVYVKQTFNFNQTHMSWDTSLKNRKRLLRFIGDFQLREQHDVMAIVVFICTYLFSNDGSEYDKMSVFVEDERTHSEFYEITAWLALRFKAVKTLKNTIMFFREYTKSSGLLLYSKDKILRSPGGDTVGIITRAWALAFLKRDLEFKEQPIYDRDWLNGEFDFWTKYTFREFKRLSHIIGATFTQSMVPYYGLRVVGSRHVRVYLVGDTYASIVNYLDRSQPRVEQLPGYVDYLFGDIGDDEWLNMVQLDFPAIDWGYLELFSLVVFAADKHVTNGMSSAFLHVQLRKITGNVRLKTLKDDKLYFVNFPRYQSEDVKADRLYAKKYTIVQPAVKNSSTPWRYMLAYRVDLPVNFHDYFVVVLRQYNYVEGSQEWHLKANVSVEFQIEYKDVVNAEPLTGDLGHNVTEKSMLSRVTTLYPVEDRRGKAVPRRYYLGLLLNDTVKPGSYRFGLLESVATCVVESEEVAVTTHCLRAQLDKDGNKVDFSKTIRCACTEFGAIYSVHRPVWHVRVLYEPISFILPASSEAPVIIICAVVMSCALILLLIAFLFDVRRVKVEQIHYVEDAFPRDQHLVLIGVHTGMNLFAGSFSHVAIKIVGSLSSSRVHILNTRRKKALRWLRDDWFVIPVNQPLGVIVNICMWHDFHLVSDWYCSRVIILDTESAKWYFVEVERWFMLYDSDEESQLVMLLAEEVTELGTAMDRHEQSYSNYFIRELQNTHSPFSAFTMHPRYIGFYEQKCLVFLVKLFALFLSSWLLQTYGFATIFQAYDSEPDRLTRVSGNTFPLIICVAVFSHIFTFPCSSIYRWYVRSRAVQLRTTHPLVRMSRSSVRSHSISQSSQIDVVGGKYDKKVSITLPKRDSRKSLSRQASTTKTPRPASTDRVRQASTDRVRQPSTDRAKLLSGDRVRQPSTDRGSRTSRSASRFSSGRTPSMDRRSRLFSRKSIINPFVLHSDRPGFWSYVLGPSQLKSVNVPMDFFRNRMHLQIGSRIAVGFMLLSLSGFFLYAEIFTDYWLYYEQSAFFVLVGLLLDIVVLEPVFIFFKSFLAYSVFHFSNTEKHLLDQEIALDVSKTPPLTFAQYVKKATRKRYKPYTSSQLADKRNQQLLSRVVLLSVLYLCILAVAFCSYYQVSWIDKKAHFVFLRSLYEVYYYPTTDEGPPMSEVHDQQSLILYVANNYIDWDFIWPNEKNISANGMRWGKGHFTKEVGAMNIMMQVLPVKRSLYQIHNELSPYVGRSRYRFLEPILTDSTIMVGDEERKYEVAFAGERIRGVSKGYYPFAGHTWQISVHPWLTLNSNLRHDLIDASEAEENGEYDIVSMIFTTNFVCPYLSGIVTVDLLYEDLPGGISVLNVHLRVSQIFDPKNYEKYPGYFYRVINSCLNVFVFVFNICIMCKVGIIKYFTSYHLVMHMIYFLAIFLNAYSSAYLYPYTFEGWAQIVDNPTDVYTELHDAHFYGDFIDSTIVCFMFCMFAVEGALMMQWALKLERMSLSGKYVSRMAVSVLMLITGFLQVYRMLLQPDPSTFPLTPIFLLKDFFPVDRENERYYDWFLIPGVVVPYLVKFCTAVVIVTYLSVKMEEVHDPVAHPIKMKGVLGYIKTHRVPRIRASDDSRMTGSTKTSVSASVKSKKVTSPDNSTQNARQKKAHEKLDRKFFFF